jgi:hypothetical protein
VATQVAEKALPNFAVWSFCVILWINVIDVVVATLNDRLAPTSSGIFSNGLLALVVELLAS